MNAKKNIAICILMICTSLFVFGQNNETKNLLGFTKGSIVLREDVLSNKNSLKNIHQIISDYSGLISSNDIKILILGYINKNDKNNLPFLNQTSKRASVIRAYLKTKYELVDSNFLYYFCEDTTRCNIIEVSFILPSNINSNIVNSNIYYTFSKSETDIRNSIQKYNGLPIYGSGLPATVANIVEICNEELHLLNKINEPTVTHKYNPEIKYPKFEDKPVIYEAKKDSIVLTPKIKVPFIGVKTNLLKLSGVSPIKEEATSISNISIELYHLKQYSLLINGSLNPLLMHGDKNEWFNHSSLSIEYRRYSNRQYKYSGIYFGPFFTYGDYDVNSSKIDYYGKTGSYLDIGITLGYSKSITKAINLELGLKGGLRIDDYSTYVFFDNNYYLSEMGKKSGFKIVEFNFGVTYRFKYKRNAQ